MEYIKLATLKNGSPLVSCGGVYSITNESGNFYAVINKGEYNPLFSSSCMVDVNKWIYESGYRVKPLSKYISFFDYSNIIK